MADEFVHSPGKWIHKVYGAVMLLILAIVFLPVGMAGKKLRQYCDEQVAGTPVEQVQSQAEERGYNFALADTGDAVVDDDRSWRRPQCRLHFADRKLVSATFAD